MRSHSIQEAHCDHVKLCMVERRNVRAYQVKFVSPRGELGGIMRCFHCSELCGGRQTAPSENKQKKDKMEIKK